MLRQVYNIDTLLTILFYSSYGRGEAVDNQSSNLLISES